jgi:hypothetical protein
MRMAIIVALVTALVGICFGISSYYDDQAQLFEARELAKQDLLERLDDFPNELELLAPIADGFKCFRASYLKHYASQVCFIDFRKDAKQGEVRLLVKYFKPYSRLRQKLYQSNETYFSFALESGELVAELYGDGTVQRIGSGKVD